MHESPRKRIHAIVADADLARGTETLASTCWPGGPADRMEPVALEWVRRWRPARAAVTLPECSCSTGRCPICN
jgi:hypothetical protein